MRRLIKAVLNVLGRSMFFLFMVCCLPIVANLFIFKCEDWEGYKQMLSDCYKDAWGNPNSFIDIQILV